MEIIVKVGKCGMVILVMNMVGWGIDIKLDLDVYKFGGLVVIGMECYESCWIDL